MTGAQLRRVPRSVWEIAVFLLIVVIALALGALSKRDAEKRLAAVEQRLEAELDAERERGDEIRSALALSEAEAVARAFAAGIYPVIVTGGGEGLDYSIGEFVRLPHLVFVHILDPAGGVLASSDRKLAVTGEAGPNGAWALETEGLRTRSVSAELVEVALALHSVAEKKATLWIGYQTGERHRDEDTARLRAGSEL